MPACCLIVGESALAQGFEGDGAVSVNSDEVAEGILKAVGQLAVPFILVWCIFNPWILLLLIPVGIVVLVVKHLAEQREQRELSAQRSVQLAASWVSFFDNMPSAVLRRQSEAQERDNAIARAREEQQRRDRAEQEQQRRDGLKRAHDELARALGVPEQQREEQQKAPRSLVLVAAELERALHPREQK